MCVVKTFGTWEACLTFSHLTCTANCVQMYAGFPRGVRHAVIVVDRVNRPISMVDSGGVNINVYHNLSL